MTTAAAGHGSSGRPAAPATMAIGSVGRPEQVDVHRREVGPDLKRVRDAVHHRSDVWADVGPATRGQRRKREQSTRGGPVTCDRQLGLGRGSERRRLLAPRASLRGCRVVTASRAAQTSTSAERRGTARSAAAPRRTGRGRRARRRRTSVVEDGPDRVAPGGHEKGREEEVRLGRVAASSRSRARDRRSTSLPIDSGGTGLPREDVPELTARGVPEREIVLEQLGLAGRGSAAARPGIARHPPEIDPAAQSLRLAPVDAQAAGAAASPAPGVLAGQTSWLRGAEAVAKRVRQGLQRGDRVLERLHLRLRRVLDPISFSARLRCVSGSSSFVRNFVSTSALPSSW